MKYILFSLCIVASAGGCARLKDVGKAPSFSPTQQSAEQAAMLSPGLPSALEPQRATASLWNGGRTSLLGDHRAMTQGDILTVVIEIDERAEISNSTARSRSSSDQVGIPDLFGIPERINENLPEGASLDSAVSTSSSSDASGTGSVRRNEKLTLRVAATVTGVMPNGVLSIEGRQEVRVNFELRELLVSGFVRPQDISRLNEITYDKIASARVSYGGRGQITDVQQPRLGSQIVDILSPF